MKKTKSSDWGIVVDKSKARYEFILSSTRGPRGTPGYLEPGSKEYKDYNKNVGKVYDHKTGEIITMDEVEKRKKSIDKLVE